MLFFGRVNTAQHIHNKGTRRANTSTNAKTSTKNDPGFESGFSD